MITLERRLEGTQILPVPVRVLRLAYADRCRSRLRARLEDGADVGLFMPRGTILRGDDVLESADGTRILLIAADEALYEVLPSPTSPRPRFDLLRAAYHLGNRHVPVQLSTKSLRLERDPVLLDLLRGLGVEVQDIVAPFEPEAGAYGGGHRHDHDASGGVLGELLSREAHAGHVPDLSTAVFRPLS
jgi:urease accessory protein